MPMSRVVSCPQLPSVDNSTCNLRAYKRSLKVCGCRSLSAGAARASRDATSRVPTSLRHAARVNSDSAVGSSLLMSFNVAQVKPCGPLSQASLAWLGTGTLGSAAEVHLSNAHTALKALVAERRPPELATVKQITSLFNTFDSSQLARRARDLYNEVSELLECLKQRLTDTSAVTESTAAADAVVDLYRGGQAMRTGIELAEEQMKVVQFPASVFIQGRSGTGKTLVLIRRMLQRRAKSLQKGMPLSQLFVTKSSLLRDEVERQLQIMDCTLAVRTWPPRGTMCVTWADLASFASIAAPSINFDMFCRRYWPNLQVQRHDLPAQMVWTEFNTRLRPFGAHGGHTLSSKDYLQDNAAAVGVPLSKVDQRAIHGMFSAYTQMKKATAEMDDADVAEKMHAFFLAADRVDELYVDEAQDFSPAELTVLLVLCHDPAGVSVAGDTCQTINPGSAFNFQDILQAFCEYGGGVEYAKNRSQASAARDAFQKQARNSRLIKLHYNYRSARAVCAVASSVSELLLQRFPCSVDRIEEKVATCEVKPNALPLFVESPNSDIGSVIMGTGSQRVAAVDRSRLTILVRDDTYRQWLRSKGVEGLVLTVAESKGLEFNSVLLVDFLGSCPNPAIWNLADSNAQLAADLADIQSLFHKNKKVGTLSEKDRPKIYSLTAAIHEFKTLYVAITRARAGCTFLECQSDPAQWEAVARHFQELHLVERCTDTRTLVRESVQKASSASVGGEVPSLARIIEERFQAPQTSSTMVTYLLSQGMQLLAHATDLPRDRWPVFNEARQTMLHCKLEAKSSLVKQVREIGQTFLLRSAQAGSVPGGGPDMITLADQVVAVLEQACYPHQSTLSLLRNLNLWSCIFEYLFPPGLDLRNMVSLIAEILAECVSVQQELARASTLAWAHFTQARATYDAQQRDPEERARVLAQEALDVEFSRRRKCKTSWASLVEGAINSSHSSLESFVQELREADCQARVLERVLRWHVMVDMVILRMRRDMFRHAPSAVDQRVAFDWARFAVTRAWRRADARLMKRWVLSRAEEHQRLRAREDRVSSRRSMWRTIVTLALQDDREAARDCEENSAHQRSIARAWARFCSLIMHRQQRRHAWHQRRYAGPPIMCLLRLHNLQRSRGKAYVAAARAFAAIDQPKLATKAFQEAAMVFQHMHEMIGGHPIGRQLLWSNSLLQAAVTISDNQSRELPL